MKKITYHEKVGGNLDNAFRYPHSCLHQDIQKFIEEKEVKQELYFVTFIHSNLFIHLHNGDRIDVWL